MPSTRTLLCDQRGASYLEYLALYGTLTFALLALATTLRDRIADAFIERSHAVLGVER